MSDRVERFIGHPEELREGVVSRAIELMEGDVGMSATRAAELAGEEYGVSGRSVLRWAVDQGRSLVKEGRSAQLMAEVSRSVVYGLRERQAQRERLVGLIERELERLEHDAGESDRTAQLQRLATAHRTLTETQHRDELHGMRMGDPDAMPVEVYEKDRDEIENVSDFEEAKRRAREA